MIRPVVWPAAWLPAATRSNLDDRVSEYRCDGVSPKRDIDILHAAVTASTRAAAAADSAVGRGWPQNRFYIPARGHHQKHETPGSAGHERRRVAAAPMPGPAATRRYIGRDDGQLPASGVTNPVS